MKNLKEFFFVLIIAIPYLVEIWYLKHGYTMKFNLMLISNSLLLIYSLLIGALIYKTYGSNNTIKRGNF